MGPIKEQRLGLGGGRVIGGIGGGKLSSFVLNSSVLHVRPGFLCFSADNKKYDFSLRFSSQLHSEGELTQLSTVVTDNKEDTYAFGSALRSLRAHKVKLK